MGRIVRPSHRVTDIEETPLMVLNGSTSTWSYDDGRMAFSVVYLDEIQAVGTAVPACRAHLLCPGSAIRFKAVLTDNARVIARMLLPMPAAS